MTVDPDGEQYKISKTMLLTFFISFFAGGIWFSIVAINYLNSLPSIIVSLYDRIYAVYLAFLDMGLAFAVGAVAILCFSRQVISAIKHHRSKGALSNNQ
jgi:hypothetical protein